MPAPQATMMAEFAKQKFMSFGIKLPTDWRQPMGKLGDMLTQALRPEERACTPTPPTLFFPPSSNKYHSDAVGSISKIFSGFIDEICGAICDAWLQWQSSATLSGVLITGPVATLGQVAGPPLIPLIMAKAMMKPRKPDELKYWTAIATVIGQAWLTYTATIKVPGLPWYPMFAAFPGPLAPPMPNVPVPIIALTQEVTALSPQILKNQMVGMLGNPNAPHHEKLFESITQAFDLCFKTWQTTTMVTNVLGTGPVPTFAPPFVPVGPVLGGIGTMTPGGFV